MTTPAPTMPAIRARIAPDVSGSRRCPCGAEIVGRRSDALVCVACSATRQRRWRKSAAGQFADLEFRRMLLDLERYAGHVRPHDQHLADVIVDCIERMNQTFNNRKE